MTVSKESLEAIQRIVGGNSNPVLKLESLVPGVFASGGFPWQTNRRLTDAKMVGGSLVITTIGRDGRRSFLYRKRRDMKWEVIAL
jgi:hypothetical protein